MPLHAKDEGPVQIILYNLIAMTSWKISGVSQLYTTPLLHISLSSCGLFFSVVHLLLVSLFISLFYSLFIQKILPNSSDTVRVLEAPCPIR